MRCVWEGNNQGFSTSSINQPISIWFNDQQQQHFQETKLSQSIHLQSNQNTSTTPNNSSKTKSATIMDPTSAHQQQTQHNYNKSKKTQQPKFTTKLEFRDQNSSILTEGRWTEIHRLTRNPKITIKYHQTNNSKPPTIQEK